MTVAWTGADTGRATLAARAMRCGSEIQLFATSGDTGVAMVLYPGGKRLPAGDYPVLAPADVRDTRPAATVASRWLDSAQVSGYRSVSGTVHITMSATRLDGNFQALMHRDGDLAELSLRGRIAAVALGACSDSAG